MNYLIRGIVLRRGKGQNEANKSLSFIGQDRLVILLAEIANQIVRKH
jgi:hypothetical protein